MAKETSGVVSALIEDARDPTRPDADRLKAIREILDRGRVKQALRLAHRMSSSPGREVIMALGKRIRTGDKQFEEIVGHALPFSEDNRKHGNAPEKRCGVLVVSPGARRIIFVFGGNSGVFHMVPAYTDRRDCHVMFLHDPSRCFHLCAIPGVGENYKQNLGTFRQLAEGLGAVEIYCVGYSAGGYPALRYGLDLGARGVLSMSGPTTLDISADPTLTVKDYPQLRAVYQQARQLAVDLVPLYAEAENPPKVLAIYGESHKRDAMLANRLAGLPNVTLEALPEFEFHGVGRELDRQGVLQTYIDRVIPPLPRIAATAVAAE